MFCFRYHPSQMTSASLAPGAPPLAFSDCHPSEILGFLKESSKQFCPMDVVVEAGSRSSSDSCQTMDSASASFSLPPLPESSSKSGMTFNKTNCRTKKSISAWEFLLGPNPVKMPLRGIRFSCRTRVTALQHLLGVGSNLQGLKGGTKGRSLHTCERKNQINKTSAASAQRRRAKRRQAKNLRRSSTAKRDGSKLQCLKCFEFFANSRTLKRHSNMHLDNTAKYICSFCSQNFDNKEVCLRHRQTHLRQTKPYLCIQCKKPFDSKKALIMHARSHNRVTAAKRVM